MYKKGIKNDDISCVFLLKRLKKFHFCRFMVVLCDFLYFEIGVNRGLIGQCGCSGESSTRFR